MPVRDCCAVEIIKLAVPSPETTELDDLQRAYTQMTREADQVLYGHGDFSDSDQAHLANWKATEYWDQHHFVAVADSRVVGIANLLNPLKEDRHLAYTYLWVHPGFRRRGVGSALARTLEQTTRSAGRSTLQAWHPGPLIEIDSPDAIVPPTGFGAADARIPAVAWMVRLGFQLGQVERISTLAIPPAPQGVSPGVERVGNQPLRGPWLERITSLRDAAAQRASGYRTVTWRGPVPEEYRMGIAQLDAQMTSDTPVGALSFETRTPDPERIAYNDAKRTKSGMEWQTTLALSVDGEAAAFTVLEWPDPAAPGIRQDATLVMPAHRGHRLGMLVKAEAMLHLVAHHPGAARIHTWNADENAYMLNINVELGYEPAGYESAWELTLS